MIRFRSDNTKEGQFMKKWLLLLVTVCALALPILAQAAVIDSGKCGSNLTWKLTDTGVLTISGSGSMTSSPWDNSIITTVQIGSGATNICAEAFMNCYDLEKVSIPSTVTKIGYSAFEGCESLMNVTIPFGVQIIDDRAFYECGLTSLKIMNSVTKIGVQAFYHCKNLETVASGTSTSELITIGESAFQNCTSLNKVTLGNKLKSIGGYAFADCTYLMSVNIPSNVEVIGYNAFLNCGGLTSITIPDSVTTIGSSAFEGCYCLETAKLSRKLTKISARLFAGCALTSITIPDSVTSIGSGAFQDCVALTNVSIGSKVITINDAAFSGCSKLTKLTIPAKVTTIGNYAFEYCSALTSITIPKTVTNIGTGVFKNRNNALIISCYYDSAAYKYAAANNISVKLLDPKPSISSHPSDLTVNAGTKVYFTVVASGKVGYLNYQWYYRTSPTGTWNLVKNNGTEATFPLVTKAMHNGYQYRCLVSNMAGSVYSNFATLTVNANPVIITQPKSQTANPGESVSFKLVASNATGYLWYYKASNASSWSKSNKTTATYTLTAKEALNGYQYKCKVSNDAGFVWSDVVKLTVNSSAKPVITAQPKSQTANPGESVSFKVAAKNATGYLWYYKGPNASSWSKSSKTTATYSLTAKEALNGYQYKCKVSNDAGFVWSDIALLTVTASGKPVITTQPTDATVKAGEKVTFKVVAKNATSYLWYYRKPNATTWTESTKTTDTYSLTAKEALNGYEYICKVSNDAGFVWSMGATLTVY